MLRRLPQRLVLPREIAFAISKGEAKLRGVKKVPRTLVRGIPQTQVTINLYKQLLRNI